MLTKEERIKKKSRGLRGTIIDSLKDQLYGKLHDEDQIIVKFHGLYQQDDRDIREVRSKKKLDKSYSFMIRLRIPGGLINCKQWLSIHNISENNSTGVIKITTRQTIQLHGIIKSKIKPTIKYFHLNKLDSIATCGDINRNVICSTYVKKSIRKIIFEYANNISRMLLPKTRSYYEIWLDEDKIFEKKEERDPLYRDSYLPRKFKIALSVPPNNDVDVFANDLGLIAILDKEKNKINGFNITVGGGLSTTHGNDKTYSRLGTVIGFYNLKKHHILKIIYEVLTIQRDYGNRTNRKLARLKYTIDNYGISWFKKKLEDRIGFSLEKEKPFSFTKRGDDFGWIKDDEGLWRYTFFIENGLISDKKIKIKSTLLEIAKNSACNFLFTCNQNLMIIDINNENKKIIESILLKYGIHDYMNSISSIRKNSMACVALNTCPLALAEGQRYLPKLIDKIEIILNKYQLQKENIIIRMTGCPNGCSRPYLSEIGLVGLSYGRYNLYLGSNKEGTRLNKIYKKNMDESSILNELDHLFNFFKKEKLVGESFGDFSFRKKLTVL
ncbi:NADPH-dependent assimilatory sulfite reductase hemoprotein subunit [Blattabacterium cuenoti]|uniref:NADPH-dependent assimilatory sulfite reductase hemoprotein subunit n=1 Tax=Blattabacterium cuenoti TaxID=1653831 RepID=UPI00163CA6CF|nr:NADPH-dependent assimilatory sulfite reductase hemoprotein subunit [Blattabacterium cuenoti]